MTGVPIGDLKVYFDEAKRWDQDRLAAAVSARGDWLGPSPLVAAGAGRNRQS